MILIFNWSYFTISTKSYCLVYYWTIVLVTLPLAFTCHKWTKFTWIFAEEYEDKIFAEEYGNKIFAEKYEDKIFVVECEDKIFAVEYGDKIFEDKKFLKS